MQQTKIQKLEERKKALTQKIAQARRKSAGLSRQREKLREAILGQVVARGMQSSEAFRDTVVGLLRSSGLSAAKLSLFDL